MKKLIILLLILIAFPVAMCAQDYRVHKVKDGETLSTVAKKYNVSEEAILKLNPDVSRGKLTATVLVIPSGETLDGAAGSSVVNFKNYTVKPKETLYSLAKENNITVKDLKKFNTYLKEEELGAGDVIRIPVFGKRKTVNYNESIQNSTFKNLTHIVLPKEGKYRIAKKYGMTVEELEAKNSDMGVLQPGQILRVNNPNIETQQMREKGLEIYQVKPKETFYSLTRRLEISRDSLEILNPKLAEEGLRAGMLLKIPSDQQTALDTLTLASGKKIELKDYIKDRSTKRIAVLLPFNLQKVGAQTNKRDLLKNNRVLQISLDFYSGAMAAIDSVEKMGIPVQTKILDTRQSTATVGQLIADNNLKDMQLIIGPLLTATIQEAGRKLQRYDVPVLSPLSNSDLSGSDNLVQTRPTTQFLQQKLIKYIDSLREGKNVLILADAKHNDIKNKLVTALPGARVVHQSKADYLQRRDLTAVLDKDRENWIIMEADDLSVVSNGVSYLNSMQGRYKIRLFTTDKNERYDDEVSSQALSNLHFTYASIAKEAAVISSTSFLQMYQKRYGISPSKYAVRGFDLTYDALLRLATGKSFFETTQQNRTTEYVENKFSYQLKSTGGYYNDAVYLIEFEEGLKQKILD